MPGLIPHDAVALGVGAFFGAMSRYQAGRLAAEWIAADPKRSLQQHRYQGWHTAAINVSGSFLLGVITALPTVMQQSQAAQSPQTQSTQLQKAALGGLSPRAKLLLGVGFCGSFTTFSTFSVDVATWIAAGQTTKALSYVLTNNVGGVLAAGVGMALVKKLFG